MLQRFKCMNKFDTTLQRVQRVQGSRGVSIKFKRMNMVSFRVLRERELKIWVQGSKEWRLRNPLARMLMLLDEKGFLKIQQDIAV